MSDSLLANNANFEACQSWLKGFLSVKEYTDVIEALAMNNENVDGSTILQWEAGDLFRLGLPKTAIPKIITQITSSRAVATTTTQNQRTTTATPLVDTVNQVDLPTTGPKRQKQQAAGSSKGRTAKQPRLSNGFEASNRRANQDNDDEDDESDNEDQQEDVDPTFNPHDEIMEEALATGYATRHRKARVAAVASASRRMQQVNPANNPSDGEDTEDDVQEEEDIATRRQRAAANRAARRLRNADAEMAAAAVDNDDDAPEEPDDGVHPRNGATWEASAREGMENILKMVPAEQLRHIVEEEGWDFNKICRFVSRKRDGTRENKFRTPAFMAPKIVKMLFDGQLANGADEDGGTTWLGIDEFLDKYVDAQYVEGYVERILKLKFAKPPKINDTRRLLWRLWSKPQPPRGPEVVTLGRVTIPCSFIGPELVKDWQTAVADTQGMVGEKPSLAIARIVAALEKGRGVQYQAEGAGAHQAAAHAAAANVAGGSGGVRIKPDPGQYDDEDMMMVDDKAAIRRRINEATANPAPVQNHINVKNRELILVENTGGDEATVNYDDLVEHLNNLRRRSPNIKLACSLDLHRSLLFIDVAVDMKNLGEFHINTAFTKKNEEYDEDAADEVDRRKYKLVQIWLDRILQAMDHLKGTDLIENRLEDLNIAWDASCDDLEAKEVPLELYPGSELDIPLFDKLMAGVEDLERPTDADIEEFCHNSGEIALNLRPYQVRALSFMMREEKAPGGTSRHLWLRVPLPGNQTGVECWMSPSLFQLYITKSTTAAQQTIGTSGGSGWQALEMGMGKTAVIIAGIVYNPPPRGWRAARRWTPYNQNDYMATVAENMPRGGTLIIVPATLIHQWKIEIEKTLDNPEAITVLDWSGAKRPVDCNEIAGYDVVISTPQNASKCSTLASIFWHRVVIDEAQLNAGSLMSRGNLYSTHRWIVTGTPCNSTPDTLGPSLDFLRLGGYDTAQRLIPPALSTVLRAVMLRYTKNGRINGEQNLVLHGISERVIECEMNEDDELYYRRFAKEIEKKAVGHINAGRKKRRNDITTEQLLEDPDTLNALSEIPKTFNRKYMHGYIAKIRSAVTGGMKFENGELEYSDEVGGNVKQLHQCTSKAELLLADLAHLKRAEPNAKILVFSEFPDSLKLVERGLPDIGLQFRSLYGATATKKRGEHIQDFMNADSNVQVFLLGARGNSAGITLTAATHIYLMEPLMNPSMELQAIGRAHRMGQQRHVHVIRMYLKNTVEEKVRNFVSRRAGRNQQQHLSTLSQVNAKSAEINWNMAEVWDMIRYDGPEDSDGEDEDVEVNVGDDESGDEEDE